MPSANLGFLVHPALGGLDTTKAETLLQPDQLVIADNIEYFTSGARKKRGGTARYNSVAMTGSITVTALADHWRHGTSLTPVQKFVGTAGTLIVKDDNDGTWDTIKTAWGTGTSQSNIVIAQGYSVFSNNNNDIPQKWDQTTMTDLTATGLPKFQAASYHLRRLFTVGEQTPISGTNNPSRSPYTAAGDITDFTGGDTGNFVIDEDDGDRLIGVSRSFYGRLYYFKGPNYGSVHEIAGRTPTTFTRDRLFTGVPCVSHAGIITTPNDIFWASKYGFHSLTTTQKYGDTEQAFISNPIQTTFNDLKQSALNNIVGFYHPLRNVVGWFVNESGQTQNTACFVYNFLLKQWAIWRFTGFNGASCAVMLDPAGTGVGQPRLYIGGYAGFVYEGDQTTLSDDNALSAYTAKFRTPKIMRMGEQGGLTELTEKSFFTVTTFFKPKGNYNANLDIDVDTRSQAQTVSMLGGGAVLDSFVLDTDVLGGGALAYAENIIEDRGRGIQLTYSQTGANQDMEIYGFGIRLAQAETHPMEKS